MSTHYITLGFWRVTRDKILLTDEKGFNFYEYKIQFQCNNIKRILHT